MHACMQSMYSCMVLRHMPRRALFQLATQVCSFLKSNFLRFSYQSNSRAAPTRSEAKMSPVAGKAVVCQDAVEADLDFLLSFGLERLRGEVLSYKGLHVKHSMRD